MLTTDSFADLILPLPLDQLFTYKIPEHLISKCSLGKRAIVQFGKKKIYSAIIRNIHQNIPAGQTIKEIIDIIDEQPIVSEKQFAFWDWMAEYYMCSLGEVCKAALPAGLRLESSTLVSYNDDFFSEDFDQGIHFNPKESLILDALRRDKTMEIAELNQILSVANSLPVIKSLYDKGSIRIEETIEKGFRPRTEKYIKLATQLLDEENLNQVFENLKRAPKQIALLNSFLELSGFEEGIPSKPVLLKTLIQRTNANAAIIKELIKKEIFEIQLKNVSRFFFEQDKKSYQIFPLQDFQQNAFDQIVSQFIEKDTVLLHGITSSGKTEIYIHLIDKYLKMGKQVLYLLPEIALTTQIIERLKRAFGPRAGVYHSKYSDAERVETYQNILGKDLKDNAESFDLILGVRSAIFLPFRDLGLIIVDEEHENTFKQFNPAPRYQSRDSAVVLAKLSGAKTLLGTATPSIETYFNAKTGKYGFVSIQQRYLDISLPEIIIADVKEARRRKQMKSHFTPELIKQIGIALKKGEQIILFQNRRGFALYIECHDCGWIQKCKFCDVSLTYHRHINQMVCHYCGYAHSVVENCANCTSTDLRTRGFGTEKVEEELAIFFPGVVVRRLDLDSAKGKHAYSNIISDFENQKIQILVGTQMVSKGLDFENVSLVGILDANQMLNFPDFRAYERSFQLMMQVGGRAGRKNKQGKVVIQTISPENQIVRQVSTGNYEDMFNTQLKERKQFHYPPFNRLVNITLKHKNKELLDNAALTFAGILKQNKDLHVIGPEFPIIGKIYELYLKNIMIKLNRNNSLSTNKQFILESGRELIGNNEFRSVQIVYDVDPY